MAITQGNIFEPSGTYSGSHFVQTLAALKEVSEVLSTEYHGQTELLTGIS